MQLRLIAPAVFAAALAALGLSAEALAADPTGIWAKDDGSAKMEVTKCGAGICSKIVWLQNPNDSRGRPLRDARNENPSMRDRPIMGLPIFKLAPAGANVWVGPVYNPEEGRIYNDVRVTLVSSRQLVLRGCKAMLFCGEKVWTRSTLPPSALPAEEEEIEAKAPDSEPAQGVKTAVATPAQTSAGDPEHVAPGVVFTTADAEPLPLSGEDVPSMMVMNRPTSEILSQAPANNEAAIAAAATEPAPPPPVRGPDTPETQVTAKPKPKGEADSPKPARVADKASAKPKPPVRQAAGDPGPRERLPWEQPQGYTPSYLGFERAVPPQQGPFGGLFGGLFRR